MINISKKIYVGQYNPRSATIEHGEITPVGTSTNEKKKISTFTKKFPNTVEYDNVPLPGFTLHKLDRRYQAWTIIDPRGFLVDITSDNLMSLLTTTGITEGLIQEKCVWARENSQTSMTLIPVSSSLYADAVSNTDIMESRVSLKDVQIGDTVLLQNKLQGKYMGVLSLYGPLSQGGKDNYRWPTVYPKRQVVEVEPNKFHYQTDVKILKIIEKTESPMTREQSVQHVGDSIASGNGYFTDGVYMGRSYAGAWGQIDHASVHAVPEVTISLEEIDKDSAIELYDLAVQRSNSGLLILEKSTGEKYLLALSHFTLSSKTPNLQEFNVIEIELINAQVILPKSKHGNRWQHHSQIAVSIDDFTKFYKLVKHVKTETYI